MFKTFLSLHTTSRISSLGLKHKVVCYGHIDSRVVQNNVQNFGLCPESFAIDGAGYCGIGAWRLRQ